MKHSGRTARWLAALLALVLAFCMTVPVSAGTQTDAVQLVDISENEDAPVMLGATSITRTLAVGQELKLTVTGPTGKVTWTSSKKSVATVVSTGTNTATVTAKKKGSATIKGKVNGKTFTCKVTVKRNYAKWSNPGTLYTGFYDIAQNGNLIPSIKMQLTALEYLATNKLKVTYKLTNYSNSFNWSNIQRLTNVYIKDSSTGKYLLKAGTVKYTTGFPLAPGHTRTLNITFTGSMVKEVVDLTSPTGIRWYARIAKGRL